jgi:hypothetical protein
MPKRHNPQQQRSTLQQWLTVGAAGLLLLCIACGVIGMLAGGSDDQVASTPPTETAAPTALPTAAPTIAPPTSPPEPAPAPAPTEVPPPPPPVAGNCDPAYANVCIPPPPPDLNCPAIREQYGCDIQVISWPDPHGIDRDGNGLGCEC